MRFRLLLPVLLFLLGSCKQTTKKSNITSTDFMIMHYAIERQDADSANKFLTYYIRKFDLPVDAQKLSDGEFYGESLADDYGYKHTAKITIQNGKIVSIEYDEIKNGHSKQTDTAYCSQMNAHQPKSAPSLTYPAYEKALLDSQNLMKIDAITGATYSLYRFRYAVIQAFMKAQKKG